MPSSPFKIRASFRALALFAALASCGEGPGKPDLGQLPGYWEIERVVYPDGPSREYAANTAVDYYQLRGGEGYLKKLQPGADGRFLASDDALPLKVVEKEGSTVLRFEGDEGFWEETLLELGRDRLVIAHANGLKYVYKRYIPMEIPGSNGTQR